MQYDLENLAIVDLEVTEVQSGRCLGHDDIVRAEDRYNRIDETPAK